MASDCNIQDFQNKHENWVIKITDITGESIGLELRDENGNYKGGMRTSARSILSENPARNLIESAMIILDQ